MTIFRAWLVLALLALAGLASAEPGENAILLGGSALQFDARGGSERYSGGGAFLIGYRLTGGPFGIGFEGGTFTARDRGVSPADYDGRWVEAQILRRIDMKSRPVRLSLVPGLGLGFETAYRHDLATAESGGPCLGCGIRDTHSRSYLVASLGAEVSRRVRGHWGLALGVSGSRFLDFSEMATDVQYAPKLESALGAYLLVQYRRVQAPDLLRSP